MCVSFGLFTPAVIRATCGIQASVMTSYYLESETETCFELFSSFSFSEQRKQYSNSNYIMQETSQYHVEVRLAALFGNVELKFWHRLYLNRRDWEMRLGKYQHHNRCDWVKKAPFVLRVKFKFERMIILHHPCEYLRIYFSWRYDSIFIVVTH